MKANILTAGAAAAALVFCATAEEPAWAQLPEITLQYAGLPGMCATVDDAGVATSRACIGAANQRFRAPGPDGGVLRYGDLCMSAPDEGNYPELRAVPCGTGGDHYWIVDHKGRLANNAGRCLALLGGSSREGERIYGARCLIDDPSPKTWRFVPADEKWQSRVDAPIRMGDACLAWREGGNYFHSAPCETAGLLRYGYAVDRPTQIRARSSCLTTPVAGSPLTLGACHDHPAQMWEITHGWLRNGNGDCAVPDAKGILRVAACPAASGPFAFAD